MAQRPCGPVEPGAFGEGHAGDASCVRPALERALSIPANLGAYMTSGATPVPGTTGAIAGSVLPIRRAEDLIATLPGVLSVRIVPSETGAIDEVHVLTTDEVPPKSTVRNIESALMAQLGLRVNHRKISIATTLDAPRATDAPTRSASASPVEPAPPVVTPLGPVVGGVGLPPMSSPVPPVPAGVAAHADRVAELRPGLGRVGDTGRGPEFAPDIPPVMPGGGGPSGPSARDSRPSRGGLTAAEGRRLLIFEDVEVRRSRTKGVLCRVTLNRDGSHYVGEAEGQETERSRVELAARATVSAITQAVTASSGGERSLSLEGAKRFDAFDREFIFVSVAARLGREMVVLTGSCEVRESAETSAVLSVLDATNRWVHLER